ncbi:hypothetical protein [Flavobacterium cellulosilyticum]|uniref:hypothetical protein n=1 Tax=Flavobacterium cellulosilyticum TaxID=2541731 RepID=UPI001404E5B7|nr:hypothetical protein [Flavobacterium cellulosilyticum]
MHTVKLLEAEFASFDFTDLKTGYTFPSLLFSIKDQNTDQQFGYMYNCKFED